MVALASPAKSLLPLDGGGLGRPILRLSKDLPKELGVKRNNPGKPKILKILIQTITSQSSCPVLEFELLDVVGDYQPGAGQGLYLLGSPAGGELTQD